MQSESNLISEETLALIKEKHRVGRQYSQNKDTAVKTCVNQLQKQVKDKLMVETQASSIKLGYIPAAWEIATLCMLLKPDKLPSLTTSYRPISLISSIIKLFKRVIEQWLCSHQEQIGFINKHQSGFRRATSTNDHLLGYPNPSWKASTEGNMYTVAAFLKVEKAFDNVWHNRFRYKYFS